MTDFPSSSTAAVYAVTITSVTIAVAFAAHRLWVRAWRRREVGPCDVLISFAALLSVTYTAAVCLRLSLHLSSSDDNGDGGRHDTGGVQAAYIAIVVSNLSLSCAKIAIGFQCIKVFTQPRILALSWAYVGVLALFAMAVCFLDVFLCLPSALAGDASDGRAACAGRFELWTATAVVNTTTDLATAILTVPLFWEFELQRRDKVALGFAFGLGISAIVFSILRLQDVASSSSSQAPFGDSSLIVWTALELNIVIACACLPNLRNVCLPGFCDAASLQIPFARRSSEHLTRAMVVQSPLGVQRSTPTPDQLYFDMAHIGPDASVSDLPTGHIFVHTCFEQQVEQAHAVSATSSNSTDIGSLGTVFDSERLKHEL